MGSPFLIMLVTDDSLKAGALANDCYSLIDSFNRIYSDYDSTSELSRINHSVTKNQPHKLSAPLWDILQLSQKAFQQSQGSFDITIGPLSMFWRKHRKESHFPNNGEVLQQKKSVGFNKLIIDTLHHTIAFPVPGTRLDLGGIAKGYIAQKVIDFLHSRNIHSALADAGGDIVMSGAPPESDGWKIGVNIPETTDELLPRKLALHNMAVATSGDAYQYFEHNGKTYSHIIDPRSGYGITTRRNVTVIAPDGATADWLATACSILPITIAKKIAQQHKAEVLITELVSGRISYHVTRGFGKYWKRD